MLKKLILFLFLLTVLPADAVNSDFENKNMSVTDSSFSSYSDSEFRQAVANILQKSNMTTRENFLNELEKVRKGEEEKKDRIYGLENINREYKKGMNGWTIALSGILVVFFGLILIAAVVQLFNYVLSDRRKIKKTVPAKKRSGKNLVQPSEEELVAISTAIELYYRLYVKTSLTNLSFSEGKDSVWKIGRNFGIRKTQRN